MVTALRTPRAKLLAAALVVATLTAGCYSGTSNRREAAVPEPGLSREIFELVNADRAANGLGPLAWDDRLAGVAQGWSDQMAASGSFRHSDINATIRRPEFNGFTRMGENILVGSCGMSAGEMEQAWMNSPSHRANILGPYNLIGIGAVCSGGRLWATQSFGTA
jgi:uncharacterized protein YkwD